MSVRAISNEEAKERIAAAEKRVANLANWIESMQDKSDVMTDEDTDLIAVMLTNTSTMSPAVYLQLCLPALARSCFYAGFMKGEEVGKLRATLK